MIRVFSMVLIVVVIRIIFCIIEKNNGKEIIKNLGKEHITLQLSRIYLWVGVWDILVCSTFILLMILFPNDTAAIWVFILFILFILLGACIIWGAQIWKVDVFTEEDYFLYRTLPYTTYKILYSDCVNYKWRNNTLILRTKRKKFYIDTYATNFKFLLSMLTKHKVAEIK